MSYFYCSRLTRMNLTTSVHIFEILRMSSIRMVSWNAAQRLSAGKRFLTDAAATGSHRPLMVSPLERAALRAARKTEAAKFLEQQKAAAASSSNSVGGSGGGTAASGTALAMSRYIWYFSVGIPVGLLAWGISDEKSLPAQFCRMIGLTGFVRSYTDEIAKPVHNKLLPDWSQVRYWLEFIVAEANTTFLRVLLSHWLKFMT